MTDSGFSHAHCLVLGGARSGKSRLAEALARDSGLARTYIATATAWDEEMRQRIARHKADRAGLWHTVEEPLALVETLVAEARPDRVVLVDCLTLWLTNVMLGGRDPEAEAQRLQAALPGLAGPAIFVSNEVGWGIVPDNALARAFRDAQGRLNQAMAQDCGRVVLVAAGLPVWLKPQGRSTPAGGANAIYAAGPLRRLSSGARRARASSRHQLR